MKQTFSVRMRTAAFLLACLFVTALALPCAAVGAESTTAASSAKSTSLGVITVCSYDRAAGVIKVAGTVNHKVFTAAENCRIALFRVPSWRSAAHIAAASDPVAEMPVAIRFEFTLKFTGEEDLLSLYAPVLIYPDGRRSFIAQPRYPESVTGDTPDVGFKGVSTDSASEIAESGAGSVLIDVYLDRLEDGRHSGYLQTISGMSFYYNREYVDDLDRRVRSASVAGASVLLRLLVSPTDSPDGLSYAASASFGAAYRGIVVSDETSALTVYAYLSFLCARYDGGSRGRVDGLVLGFCADLPDKYNFCASTGPMYYEIYSRTLALIGIAAGEGMRLVVPVSDECGADGSPVFSDFVEGVAAYISAHTDLEFTVMIDSTHNAYHLDDSYFDLPTEGGDDDAAYPRGDSQKTPDPKTDGEETKKEPVPTSKSDGYFCTDSVTIGITPLASVMEQLCDRYNSLRRSFIWCWTPDESTSGSALSVLYAYNYMALTAMGAEAFVLRTDSTRFTTVSHLVKYIDTDSGDKATSYALEVFGVTSWSVLFPGLTEVAPGGRKIIETELLTGAPDLRGRYTLWNFSAVSGAHGWAAGPGCRSLRSVFDDGEGCLKAVFGDESGGAYSDICSVFVTPEPSAYTSYAGFDLSCSGGAEGDIYEIKLVVYSGGVSVEGKTVMTEGERKTLYIDISGAPDDAGIDAVRIAARRVSGEGDITLRTYEVSLCSREHSDRELAALIAEAHRSGDGGDASIDDEASQKLLTAVLLIAASVAFGGYAAVLLARRERRDAGR